MPALGTSLSTLLPLGGVHEHHPQPRPHDIAVYEGEFVRAEILDDDPLAPDDLICAVIEFILTWCSARARQRAAYGWGNKWRVSREHPAICVFLDEWPQRSDRAEKLWIRFLLLGRKDEEALRSPREWISTQPGSDPAGFLSSTAPWRGAAGS
ncbi:hypothetical protein ACIRQP_38505 [Streptomyces sp. NPDC102274]|uniref:hypothetical protein n=1 Tax=Streptomyces sp. NPDC102274 TaxID=3366151 RepID=UPI00381567C4